MSEKMNGNELERVCGGTGKPMPNSNPVACSMFRCTHCGAGGIWVTHKDDCPHKDITQSNCDVCNWGVCGGPRIR